MFSALIKWILRIIAAVVVVLILIIGVLVFIPINPAIQGIEPRESTQYWTMGGGYRIAYSKVSAAPTVPSKPPIVYLHGGPGGYVHSSTIDVFGEFGKLGHDVYLYDQSGTGLSERRDKPKETSILSAVDDLFQIVDEKIRAPKVVLSGQSFGGELASRFAAMHPDRVAALILTSPGSIEPSKFDDEGAWINEKLYPVPAEFQFIAPSEAIKADMSISKLPLRAIASIVVAQFFDIKFASDEEIDGALNDMAAGFTQHMVCDPKNVLPEEGGAGAYSRSGMNFFPDDLPDPRQGLTKLSAPTFVLQGQCDTIDFAGTYEYVDLIPNAEYAFIKGAGHIIYWDKEQQFVKRISEFLSKHF